MKISPTGRIQPTGRTSPVPAGHPQYQQDIPSTSRTSPVPAGHPQYPLGKTHLAHPKWLVFRMIQPKSREKSDHLILPELDDNKAYPVKVTGKTNENSHCTKDQAVLCCLFARARTLTVYWKSSPTVFNSTWWIRVPPKKDLWNHLFQNTQLLGVFVAAQFVHKYMRKPICFKSLLVGVFNPLEKYARQIGSFPRVEVNKYEKTTTQSKCWLAGKTSNNLCGPTTMKIMA